MKAPYWTPSQERIAYSNIYKMMRKHHFTSYGDFWKWSVQNKTQFWTETLNTIGVQLSKPYEQILNTDKGVEKAQWLFGAQMNIVDSCFQNSEDAIAIVFQKPNKQLQKVSQKELKTLVNKIANGLQKQGIVKGDTIAIDMPMTLEAVAIYLGALKAGIIVATIADSFTANEIEVRLKITQPKLVFTQDTMLRAFKSIPLYKKVVEANAKKIVVIPQNTIGLPNDVRRDGKKQHDENTDRQTRSTSEEERSNLRAQDIYWNDFLSNDDQFDAVQLSPDETCTILFSSGTTGDPKAIPWSHSTPIKSAADGYYHQDIHQNDVVCWPTNLGWMMGPWLVFAALMNKATIALYYDAPLTSDFGAFVQNAKVTMLGVIPSIVKHWKNTACMEGYDWNAIQCFSSTGEVSNPIEMEYLMQLANNKPVIEYCGGTEIGGGYVSSTVVQPNIPSVFSTQTLGGQFVLLNDEEHESDRGELFLVPPILGLSTHLLNRDHHEVYYKDTPKHKQVLRRHGDELIQLENGYFKTLGRVDDAMNLGGIKVSATQIEAVILQLEFIKDVAAIAIAPPEGGPSKLVIYYVENAIELTHDERLKQVQKKVRSSLNPLFKVADLVKIQVLPRTASNKVMRRKLRDEYNA